MTLKLLSAPPKVAIGRSKPWTHRGGALLALALSFAVAVLPAKAQEKSCCNLASGQFEAAASPEACEAAGDRVALGSTPDSFMRAAICFQNATQ